MNELKNFYWMAETSANNCEGGEGGADMREARAGMRAQYVGPVEGRFARALRVAAVGALTACVLAFGAVMLTGCDDGDGGDDVTELRAGDMSATNGSTSTSASSAASTSSSAAAS